MSLHNLSIENFLIQSINKQKKPKTARNKYIEGYLKKWQQLNSNVSKTLNIFSFCLIQ